MQPPKPLPPEVWLEVFQHLGKSDLKTIRFISRTWSDLASRYLFDTVYVSSFQIDYDNLVTISQHPRFPKFVRSLRFDGSQFTDRLTKGEYLGLVTRQISALYRNGNARFRHTPSYTSNDPDVNELLDLLDEFDWNRTHWRKCEDLVSERFSDANFVTEGYNKFIEHARTQKRTHDCTDGIEYWQKVWIALKQFPNIEVVTLSSQWCCSVMSGIIDDAKAVTYGKLLPFSSPLTRSWSVHHLRPLQWSWMPIGHIRPITGNGTMEFMLLTIVTRALATVKPVRRLEVDRDTTQLTAEMLWATRLNGRHFLTDLISSPTGPWPYKHLAELNLCVDTSDAANLPVICPLLGLQSLLRGAPLLERLTLALQLLDADDEDCMPGPIYTIDQVFPTNPATVWAHLRSFKITHLKVDPDSLGNLLVGSMPNLGSMYFGNIELTSGTWQDIVSFMRQSMVLKKFKIYPEWPAYLTGWGLLYPNRRIIWSKDEPILNKSEPEFLEDEHRDYMKAIGHYVVHGGQHPMINTPSSQEASNSALPESWKRRPIEVP
ncbi:MAG: hypothetical protein LQ350_006350 [Teloschistes chrysophthalmus]|nr:MAG: hypothetical protein LQ350_006350 [Niorma chrysophthalma]